MKTSLAILLAVVILMTGAFLMPWQKVDWGKIQLSPSKTITVFGQAKSKEKNQIATFSAGVSAVNDNKENAINEVNQKIQAIIDAVKNFGISSDDLQTQNLSVYQSEETYYEESVQKSRPGQWRVSNTITVTLRNLDKASDLANLLSRGGATNVYGPNFAVDETGKAEKALLEEAIKDAQEKAGVMAKAGNGQLGKIISITEGIQNQPIYYQPTAIGMGGGGTPVEPGSSTLFKTVTVVFELK